MLDFIPALPVTNAVPQQTTVYESTGKGDVTISVQDSQTVGSVPRGATRIPMMTLSVSTSCTNDVKLQSIDIKHKGLGNVADISNVYAMDDFRRLSRGVHFERNGNATLSFPNLTIKKCSAMNITIYTDMSSDADIAGEHGVTITGAPDIHTSAATTTFNQSDDTKRVIATPKQNGTLTVNFLPISTLLRYGRIETVARMQFTTDNQSAQLIKKVTLKNRGDARDMNLINFTIETPSGKVLSRLQQRMDAKNVTLEFSPSYILPRSTTVVLVLKAEVKSNYKKVDFYLEEPADLDAKPTRDQ
jgi:hypothetical protein